MNYTYEDVHQHVQRQSHLLTSFTKSLSNLFTFLLDKPHNVLYIFSNISNFVLL